MSPEASVYSQPMILMNPYQNLCFQGCSLFALIEKHILRAISIRLYSNQGLISLSMDSEVVLRHIICKKNVDGFVFGCQLLGYVFWAVRPSVSYNDAKGTIPVREKQQKHSRSLAKTMKRINQTNSKTN